MIHALTNYLEASRQFCYAKTVNRVVMHVYFQRPIRWKIR